MGRFDSKSEFETHELGRSLLFMIRDDDMGFEGLPRDDPPDARTNPFTDVRERLAAMDSAIRELQPQVHTRTHYWFSSKPTRISIDGSNTECKVGRS